MKTENGLNNNDGFICSRCGNCCTVKGYVHLQDEELKKIAEYLSISLYEFTNTYTRLLPNRIGLSLIEDANGNCIFLSEERTCRINDVKPEQCRGFPLKWNFEGYEMICDGYYH